MANNKTRYEQIMLESLKQFEILDDRTGKTFENILSGEKYIVDVVGDNNGVFVHLRSLSKGVGIQTNVFCGTEKLFYEKYREI
jgi:hypothetical protein